MEITRENLRENLTALQEKLSVAEGKVFEYKTKNSFRTFDPINTLCERGLCNFIYWYHKKKKTTIEHRSVLDIYGVRSDFEIPQEICCCSFDDIDADIKTRLSELNNIEQIHKLKLAISKLTNHLSDDDKFAMDLDIVSNLI